MRVEFDDIQERPVKGSPDEYKPTVVGRYIVDESADGDVITKYQHRTVCRYYGCECPDPEACVTEKEFWTDPESGFYLPVAMARKIAEAMLAACERIEGRKR